MTKDRKETVLPNGFRLVTDENTSSKNVKMLGIAKKRRAYQDRKKQEAKAKRKAAKEALKLQKQQEIESKKAQANK